MNRSQFRLAVVVSASLFALPVLAVQPASVVQSDWPALETPRPARVLPAQPAGTPSAISGDPTWPVVAASMPAISYPSRTELRPVFDPPVEGHVKAMAASPRAAQPAPTAQLAAK